MPYAYCAQTHTHFVFVCLSHSLSSSAVLGSILLRVPVDFHNRFILVLFIHSFINSFDRRCRRHRHRHAFERSEKIKFLKANMLSPTVAHTYTYTFSPHLYPSDVTGKHLRRVNTHTRPMPTIHFYDNESTLNCFYSAKMKIYPCTHTRFHRMRITQDHGQPNTAYLFRTCTYTYVLFGVWCFSVCTTFESKCNK